MFPGIHSKQYSTLSHRILILQLDPPPRTAGTGVVTIANSPSFLTNHPHPLPWIPASAPLNVVWNLFNEPYLEEMSLARLPDGSSYDLGGMRFSQNNYTVSLRPVTWYRVVDVSSPIETDSWLQCNLCFDIVGFKCIFVFLKSGILESQERVVRGKQTKFVTYVWWCFL